jgi:hypothetical protein
VSTGRPNGRCTREGDCLAACLAAASGTISHTTAARLWGFRRVGAGTDVHLTIREPARVIIAGVHVHHTVRLDRSDVVKRSDGIRITNPLRTACDLASVLDDEDLASVIEQVLDQFRVRFRTLLITAERRPRQGSSGAARLRRVLLGRPEGRPSQSHLEVRVATALRRSGLGPAIRQMPIDILPGVTVHADLPAGPSVSRWCAAGRRRASRRGPATRLR